MAIYGYADSMKFRPYAIFTKNANFNTG